MKFPVKDLEKKTKKELVEIVHFLQWELKTYKKRLKRVTDDKKHFENIVRTSRIAPKY